MRRVLRLAVLLLPVVVGGVLVIWLLPSDHGSGRATAGPSAGIDDDGDPLPAFALRRFGSTRLRPGNVPVALSPDGKTLVSGHADGVVRIWDVATGRVVRTIDAHVLHVRARTRDPLRIARRVVTAARTTPDPIVAVDVSADGALIVSAGGPCVRVFDAATGDARAQWIASDRDVRFAHFAPDGRNVVLGAPREELLWTLAADGADGASAAEPTPRAPGAQIVGPSSPDGVRVLAMSGHVVEVIDAATQRCLGRVEGSFATGHSVSRGGRLVVRTRGVTRVLDDSTLAPAGPTRDGDAFTHAVWSADGRTLALAGTDGRVRFADLATHRLRDVSAPALTHPVRAFCALPDGRFVWSVSDTRVARRAADGVRGDDVRVPPVGVLLVRADGSVATLVQSQGQRAPRLAAADGASVALQGLDRPLLAIDVSADRRRLVGVTASGHVQVWDCATGARVAELPGGARSGRLAISADGRHVADLDDDPARSSPDAHLWCADAPGPPVRIEAGRLAPGASSLAVANGGVLLAFGAADGRVHLVEPGGTTAAAILDGHAGPVAIVTFSPDGTRLASVGSDGTVVVWDVAAATRRP